MRKEALKFASLALSVFLIAGSLGACKKSDDVSTSPTAKSTQSAPKTTPGKTGGTQAKTTGTTTSKSTGTVNSTASTAANSAPDSNSVASNDGRSNVNEVSTDISTDNPGSQPGDAVGEASTGTKIFKNDKPIDLAGRTLTIWSQWSPEDIFQTEGFSASYDALLSSLKEAEKKYNCKIIFRKPPAEVKLKEYIVNTVLSGLPTDFDALDQGSENACPAWSDNNIILPLDDYIDFSQPVFSDGITIDGLGIWKGKHWGFPEPNSALGAVLNGCQYNRDILEQYALQDPQDIEAAGQWNWDTFLDMAQKLTVDLNGDGVIDQFGLETGGAGLAKALIYSNSGRFIKYEDGITKLAIMEPNSVRAMNFATDLTSIYKVVGGKLTAASAAMYFGHSYTIKYTREKGLPNVGLVLVPHGPDATDNGNVEAGGRIFVFPSNLQDAENVVKVISDAVMSWDKTKSYWTSGRPAPNVNGTYNIAERDLKYYDTVGRTVIYQLINGIPDFTKTFDNAIKAAMNQETSVQASLESIRVPLENILEQYVNN